MNDIDRQTVVGALNRLLEAKLAGVVGYTHDSFLVFGFGRIPIVSQALRLYRELLVKVEGKSVALEEFSRQMILAEEMHAAEVDKMLRKPGELAAFAQQIA